jgi:hypothetical protein
MPFQGLPKGFRGDGLAPELAAQAHAQAPKLDPGCKGEHGPGQQDPG